MSRLSIALFAALLAALALSSQNAVAAVSPSKAIVVLNRSVGRLHSGINTTAAFSVALDASFDQVSRNYGTAATTGNFGGDMAAGAIGGIIAGAIIASKQQKAADAIIAPLTSLVSEKERDASVRSGIAAALALRGITDVEYITSDAPDAKLLPRVVTDDGTALVLFLDSDTKDGFASSLVTLSSDNRTLRFAARLAWVEREGRRFSKVVTRRVNLLSYITRAEEPAAALSERVTAGGQALLRQIESATTQLVELALSQPAAIAAGKDDRVAFVNAAGAFEVSGELLKQGDGQILVIDKRGNLAAFSADMVLTN